MSGSNRLPQNVLSLLHQWAEAVKPLSGQRELVRFFQKEHPRLLKNHEFFHWLLDSIVTGKTYPDTRRCEIFQNEMLLYIDPSRLFSLRFAILAPGDFTVVHDHNSWGVMGAVSGKMAVEKFRLADSGASEQFAVLERTRKLLLEPGQTDFTLALDEGIHRTGNPTEHTMVTASIYGKPIRRLFIRGFDLKNHRVFKLYPPRLEKKRLASQALKHLAREGKNNDKNQ